MLDKEGFDLWADGYEKTVGRSEEEDRYPFAGYQAVLGEIYDTISRRPKASVLDVGFGTGTLTARLYGQGCKIYGQDFSPRMIELASRNMPGAKLYPGDLTQGLVKPLQERRYDFIVSTYALHHLTDEQKRSFLADSLELLNEGGEILIGDVAFRTRPELEACRRRAGKEWDDEEFYFVADELKAAFPQLVFHPRSYCSGVLIISKE